MKKYNPYIILFLLLIFTNSCDKGFEEINQNPYNPTETDIGPLFNEVISSLQLGWNEQFYLHNETLYQLTQQAALTQTAFQNVNIGKEDVWQNYYTALAQIREIEKRIERREAETEEIETLNNIKAQVKILLAYKTFRVTDLFGDIPFFDAGQGFQDIDLVRPKFDSQEGIYKFLLDELKWAAENIDPFPNPTTEAGTAYQTINEFDSFFNGDMLRWIKFANSLRLRHALRMSEKDPDFAFPILGDIIMNDLDIISENDEVVMMHPAFQTWRRQSSHWSFREHNNLRMGETIWSQFSENDEANGSGIYDPRAFVFFETNNVDEWIPFPQLPSSETAPAGGTPYGGQRDNNYAIKGNGNIYSPFNYYLIRDEETIPEIILTAAEMDFVKAEVYLRGLGVPIDIAQAEASYSDGVAGSVGFWKGIVANSSIWEAIPPQFENISPFSVANHPNNLIFGAENRLELIYKQKWIDAFRQPWEAYSLLRRTGQTPRMGEALNFFRFTYPTSELEGNPERYSEQIGRMGADSEQTKIWLFNYEL